MFLLLVGDDIKLRQIASSTSVPMTQKHLANVTSHRTTFCHLYYLTCQDDILQTAIEHKNCRGRGGGQVVTFYSDDLSSTPAESYSFFLSNLCLKRTKRGLAHFLKKHGLGSNSFRNKLPFCQIIIFLVSFLQGN